MRIANNIIYTFIFVFLMPFINTNVAFAQQIGYDSLNNRIVKETHVNAIELGMVNSLDSYLSNEKYNGKVLGYITSKLKNNKTDKLSTLITWQGRAALLKNNRGSENEIYAKFLCSISKYYAIKPIINNLDLKVGAGADINIATIYNMQNSNNPIQVYAFTNLSAAILTTYHARLKHIPIDISYQLSVPMIGVAFSPRYGQSYYEIFALGNYDRNIIITNPFIVPTIQHSAYIDITMWKNTFRIGYMGYIRKSDVNGINIRTNSNAVFVGLVKHLTLIK